jgi:hypothetical protein
MKVEVRPDKDRQRYSKASEKRILSCPPAALIRLTGIEGRTLTALQAKQKKLLEEAKKKGKRK